MNPNPANAPALTPCQTLSQGAYYHELFLRGKRFLCRRMKRTLNKTSAPNALSGDDEPAPDFYAMPSLPAEVDATASSPADNEAFFRRPPQAHGGLKTPHGSFGKNVDASAHDGLASPAVLVSSSLRSDASSRAIPSATQQLTWSQNLPSLFHCPRVVPLAPSLAANVGEYAGLPAEMSSLNPRWLLDRRALLSQQAATAVAALLTSQAQTLALQQLASSLSAFPSGPSTVAQAPADPPNLARYSSSRLPRSRNDYQHPFTPQLSRTLPLTPLQAFLQQQQLLRQLQSQPEQRQRGSEESKSTDYAALMEAYMQKYNESKDAY
jgi:hypothetical protein